MTYSCSSQFFNWTRRIQKEDCCHDRTSTFPKCSDLDVHECSCHLKRMYRCWITFFLSPPKLSIFAWTHSSAANWSLRARLRAPRFAAKTQVMSGRNTGTLDIFLRITFLTLRETQWSQTVIEIDVYDRRSLNILTYYQILLWWRDNFMRPYPNHALSHNGSSIERCGFTGIESATIAIPTSYTTWVKERWMVSRTSKTSVGRCEIFLKKDFFNINRLCFLTTGSFAFLLVPEGL